MANANDPASELARLREEYLAAVDETKAILMANGMEAPEFVAAKQVAGDLWRAILAIDPNASPSDFI